MAGHLKVKAKMFARDAMKIRSAAKELDRQAMFYEQNGPADVLRFRLIELRARGLEKVMKRAMRRYELYERVGWD